MGLDPGYRMGCKVAVVDGTGKVLDTAVVYPTLGEAKKQEAITKLSALIKKHKVEHIAIGNGTASRETENMTAEMLKGCPGVSYMVVNEAGASVYSASKLAAEEFPQFDVNLRSAVSIARRLQDPLAELVKIEPKAIGVGQYQHDMPQKRLEETLDGVVEDCVNAVGVDLNTASPSLLRRVSGLNAAIAKNIVAYREENGAYTSRKQILKVPKLGPKAFEQCAGFLRVPESKKNAKKSIRCCKVCMNFTEHELCRFCADGRRDHATVCVVETPKDIAAFERTKEYRGVYHVLHGLISPIDGIRPDDLKIKELLGRVSEGGVEEVIMATNPTVEGEATAMYVSKLLKPFGVKVTRLAFGLPIGGMLEYADEVTLYKALENRSEI